MPKKEQNQPWKSAIADDGVTSTQKNSETPHLWKSFYLAAAKKHRCNHAYDAAEATGTFGITFGFTIPKQDSEVALGIQGRSSRIF